MKGKNIFTTLLGLLLLAGCASESDISDTPVRVGMSRETLRSRYGDPVRIEKTAGGGEDWYYRFVSWNKELTGSTDDGRQYGQATSSVTTGLTLTRTSEVKPVHVSPEGRVVEPVPQGKVTEN